MSTQDAGKDAKGRSWDQVTDGTTSAATMGAGSTGEVGASAERKDPARRQQQGSQQQGSQQQGSQQQGSQQQGGQGSGGRTDDLLAGGSNDEQSDQGFQGGANRQSGDGANRQGGQGASAPDDDQYDQGTARRENR